MKESVLNFEEKQHNLTSNC